MTKFKRANLNDAKHVPVIREVDVAWVVPWCVVADHNGDLWIDGDQQFTDRQSGTSNLHLVRYEDGWVMADVPEEDNIRQLPGNGTAGLMRLYVEESK